MNQNDMDRYYWRTGQRWSGDYRRERRWRIGKREILMLAAAFAIAIAGLFLR